MDESYIVFRTYSFPHQAEMVLGKLQSEDIDAYLTDSNMGSFSFMGAATGGVKVHVSESDLEQAKMILSRDESKN